MAKLEDLATITSGYLANEQINSNFTKITTALNNTLSRDGSTPNSMGTALDMNNRRIINVASPVNNTDVATKGWVTANSGDLDPLTAVESFTLTATGGTTGVALGARFGDLKTIRDFGAVGDGITDDSSAFTAAQSAGEPVRIPADTFLVSEDVTLTIPVIFEGGIIKIDTGNTITFNGQIVAPISQIFTGAGSVRGSNTVAPFLFPEWWGAVADGKASTPTDSTTAVQAAMDFCATGEVTIFFSGMYSVQGVSTTLDGVNFYAPKCGTTKSDGSDLAGLSAYTTQDYLVKAGDGATAPPEVSHTIYSGITFDGRDQTINEALLYVEKFSQCKLQNCTFREAYGAGVKGRKFEDVNFDNCQFVYLGYNASSANATGAVVFDEPLADGIINNIVRFTNCRFEWVDGGFFRFNDQASSGIGGLFIHGCKFEVGSSGVYGTHRGDWALFELVNDSTAAKLSNVRITDCWLQNVGLASEIIRISNFRNFVFENNTLSSGADDVVLFNVQTTAGAAITASGNGGFVFRNNTFTDYDVSVNNDFSNIYKCAHQAIYEPPVYFRAEPTFLQKLRVDNALEAHEIADEGNLVSDPDSNDPCFSKLGSVASVSGANTANCVRLGGTRFVNDIVNGLQGNAQGLLRLRVRCKKAGNTASASFNVYAGTAFINSFTVPSYYYETVEVYLNLREHYTVDTGILIQNSSGNNAGHTLYIDTIQVDWVNYFKRANTPTTGTWDDGDIVYYTAPTASSFIGEVCTTEGTFGTLSSVTADTTSGSNIISVNDASDIRKGMYISTAAGGITRSKVINVNGTDVTVRDNASSNQTGTAVSYAAPVFKTWGATSA